MNSLSVNDQERNTPPDKNDPVAVLAYLKAYRAARGIATPDIGAIIADNDRLARARADRLAVQDGQRALDQRRAQHRAELPPAPRRAPVYDAPTRITPDMLAGLYKPTTPEAQAVFVHDTPDRRAAREDRQDRLIADCRARVMVRYHVDLPRHYAVWLLTRPEHEHLGHLRAWQQVARQRAARGADVGDLAGLLDAELPDHDPDQVEDLTRFSLGLRVYVKLTAAAIRADKTAAAFVYWVVQHRADHRRASREKFTLAELRDYMASLGILWSDRRIRDALRQGLGVFWSEAHRRPGDRRQMVYTMHAKERAMGALGIVDPGKLLLIADDAWRVQDVRQWRAFVWSAFASSHPGNGQLARATLAKAFGVSRRTSRNYDLVAGTRIQTQQAAAPKPGHAETAKQTELERATPKHKWYVAEKWKVGKRRFGRVWLCWQDVNIYASPQAREAGSSRRKRLMRQVARSITGNVRPCAVAGCESGPVGSSDPVYTRRFADPERAQQYQRKHAHSPVKVPLGTRHRLGYAGRPAPWVMWRFTHSLAAAGVA